MQFPIDFINKFICGDSLTILKQIPDNSINTVVTSPPYNKHNRPGGESWGHQINYGDYKDNMPELQYQEWQKSILTELVRIINPSGSIFYNHKPRQVDYNVILPTNWLSNFNIRQIIIWRRTGDPNVSPICFLRNTEWIIWIRKSHPRFNPEYFKYGEVWNITQEMNSNHPAPFPIELPLRCVQATTSKGDIVLDPFIGSGTTAVACKKTGRNFIGIDMNPEYIKMAERRLSSYTPIPQKNNAPLTIA